MFLETKSRLLLIRVRVNNINIMSKEQAPGRIFMVKVPTQRVRSRFNLPESNRYFAKVLKNNKLISESNFD